MKILSLGYCSLRKMLRLILFVVFVGASCTAVAQSFSCEDARTKVEKLICASENLAALDTVLDSAYQLTLSKSDPDDAGRLLLEQRSWLRSTRNACRDEACLERAYSQRIGEVDPFADKSITCAEMKKFPKLIFAQGIDLGSGSGSPINFDYQCKESLALLPFVQRLAALTEQIRAEGGPQLCTGSIIHAHSRYFQYTLTAAGIAPKALFPSGKSAENSDTLRYFEQWSWESPYNYLLHREYFTEFGKSLPQLAAHYARAFGYSGEESQNVARRALMIFVDRAAGSFPRDSLKDWSTLVELAADEKSVEADLRSALADLSTESTVRKQAYRALKVALLHDRPRPFISLLLDAIGKVDDKELNEGEESLLFFALPSGKHVPLLIDRGATVDYANSFGKTPLFYAIGFNDYGLVETLLSRGADPNHPYKSAKELNPDDSPCSANTHLRHTQRTPLMHAGQHSDVAMLKLLIDKGAKTGALDELGFTILDYAVMGEKSENREFLASLGLKLGAPTYPLAATGRPVPEKSSPSPNAVPVEGFVNRLAISPGRPDILVASIISWDRVQVGPEHGLYLFSLQEATQPRTLAHIPGIRPADFALSADGKTAYVMHMWYQGAPEDKEYGLLVIDIARPESPRLAAVVEGDFMTMRLSRDGKYLYLQERNLPRSPSRGTVVLAADPSAPQLLCSNPFGQTRFGRHLFAYSFATFPDEPLLAIVDQLGGVYLYDVSDPCKAKPVGPAMLSNAETGTYMVGLSNRRIYVNAGGLMEYKLSDPPAKLSSWVGNYSELSVNEHLGFMAAVFGNEVVLLKMERDGSYLPIERFGFAAPTIGGVALSDSGMLYVGVKDGLHSMAITRR